MFCNTLPKTLSFSCSNPFLRSRCFNFPCLVEFSTFSPCGIRWIWPKNRRKWCPDDSGQRRWLSRRGQWHPLRKVYDLWSHHILFARVESSVGERMVSLNTCGGMRLPIFWHEAFVVERDKGVGVMRAAGILFRRICVECAE